MNEQAIINQLFSLISNKQDITNIKKIIDSEYKNSVILHYYIGFYYDQKDNLEISREYLEKCIKINPLFTASYFLLTDPKYNIDDITIERLLMSIYNKKTVNPKTGKLLYQIETYLRICSILGPILSKTTKNIKKAYTLYKTAIDNLIKFGEKNFEELHNTCWKNLCYSIGNIIVKMKFDANTAIEYFKKALSISHNQDLDKKIVGEMYLLYHYTDIKLSSLPKLSKYYPLRNQDNKIINDNNLIHIGYITPDLNKNAVGMFSSALLYNHDSTKFKVFVYYNNINSDEFTEYFKQAPNINWMNISVMDDDTVYTLMKNVHKIQILIDLISIGVDHRLSLICRKPAPIIINYLGYPGTSGLECYTHRITDNLVDNDNNIINHTEQLLFHPRSFLCYKIPSFIQIPEIEINDNETKQTFNICVMNRTLKQNPIILNAWK